MSDTYETVIFICPKVSVYQVPPLSGKGFRTDSWGSLAKPIFVGRLRVMQTYGTVDSASSCDIRIEDAQSGELFASAPYVGEHAVERAQDSSRYYQVRVVHEKKVAYLGIGFDERETSFDFQVALADFLKHVNAVKDSPKKNSEPAKDYSLKEGQSMNISIGGPTKKSMVLEGPTRTDSPGVVPFLPPPPSASTSRRLTESSSAKTTLDDEFGEFQE